MSSLDPHSMPDDVAEERDPVWRLLDAAPAPLPDPWFAARTVARCRLASNAEVRSGAVSFAWRWALGLGACAALVLGVSSHHQAAVAGQQKGVQEAFEIMATMDPDSDASATSSSWTDSSL